MEAILKKELISHQVACKVIGIGVFIILTALGGFVRIPLPFTPVPITLQTFFVLLSGAFLGSSLGLVSQLGYISLGVLGVPLFTGYGSGFFYLAGPSGGYLLGFLFASFFSAKMLKYSRDNFSAVFFALTVSSLLILSCGVIWLKVISGYALSKLFLTGFIPFLPGDLLKAALAASIYLRLKSRIKQIF